MKNIATTLIAILLSTSLGFSQTAINSSPATQQAKFNSFLDSASYAYGVVLARSMEGLKVDFNHELIQQAFKDVRDKINLYNDTTINSLLTRLQTQIQTREMARIEVLTKENAIKTKAFFEENGKKPNIKTTASGLQYETIVSGPSDGIPPSINDTVVVNFEAKFIDGKSLESSYESGKPVHMPLNQIIPGLQEGLLLMKPKDTFILYIPSELAYGDKGAPAIEPNQGLIFKIDLIDIIKGAVPLPKY